MWPLNIYPHLLKCTDDYRIFIANQTRRSTTLAVKVKEKKRKTEEPTESPSKVLAVGDPLEGSDKALIEPRCHLPEHLCPTPTSKGGQNKPIYLITGTRIVKFCRMFHLKDADVVKFLLQNLKDDTLKKLLNEETCADCENDLASSIILQDSRATIKHHFCGIGCSFSWAKKKNQTSWNTDVRDKNKKEDKKEDNSSKKDESQTSN